MDGLFTKTGNPNGENLPEWKPVTMSQQLVLCWGEADTYVGKPSKLKLLKTMLTNKAVRE